MEDDFTFDTGCCCCDCTGQPAHLEPAYVEPEPVWEEPVYPEPFYVEPEPVFVEPEPVDVEPTPVYAEPAPPAPAPVAASATPAPQPQPVYSEPAPVLPAAPSAIGSGTMIIGGNSSPDFEILTPTGEPADVSSILGGDMILGGPGTGIGSGGGVMDGFWRLTELVAERQNDLMAELDAASSAPVSADTDLTSSIVMPGLLRNARLAERGLLDVMSPLWSSSDMFDPYSPRYPHRA